MPSSIDLIIKPLIRSTDQNVDNMPGLYTTSSPRKCARGRSRDRLILYLSWYEGNSLPPEKINPLLEYLVRTYFRTPGPVTSAQRAVVEAINQLLLDRNLKEAMTGQQAIGWLTQVVVRDTHLYIGQSGHVHAFLLNSSGSRAGEEARHIFDPQLTGRGLGISRTSPVRFTQAELKPGDSLLLTTQPPDSWTAEALQGAHNQGQDSLVRRLFDQSDVNMHAVLILVQPGSGKLETLKPLTSLPFSSVQRVVKAHLEVGDDEDLEGQQAFSAAYRGPGASEVWIGGEPPTLETHRPLPAKQSPAPNQYSPSASSTASLQSSEKVEGLRGRVGRHAEPYPDRPAKAKKVLSTDLLRLFKQFFNAIGRAVKVASIRLLNGIVLLLKAILPDSSIFKLPPSTMAFFAIAVPLVVVTIASLVYLQRGQGIYYDYYFQQALDAAEVAEVQSAPQDLRQAWSTTLTYLDQAEHHRQTPESGSLRDRALQVLDSLDFVERLDFVPALTTPLGDSAHISRMVTTNSDLYLLNAHEGDVIRATISNNGYVIDPFFKCAPGPYGSFFVGAITDITPLPRGHDTRATVLAIDANGNLLYCIPGEDPMAQPLAPPDTSWGNPEGLVFDTGDLYVLDPKTNAVWIYRNLDVSTQPRFFFGEQVPPMQDVIDLAVNRPDLYLLHTDGHMTTCTYSGLAESPTRCEEPAQYIDPRPGRQDAPIIEGAYFTEVLFAPPPDPSIYMLEPATQAVYHFSVRLTYQRQYRSSQALPSGPATAFAINHTNRTVFIAIGNEVFYAGLP
jgi:hypothetical protein